jgi:hypothetical protein
MLIKDFIGKLCCNKMIENLETPGAHTRVKSDIS